MLPATSASPTQDVLNQNEESGWKLQQAAMVAWLVGLHMDTELRGF